MVFSIWPYGSKCGYPQLPLNRTRSNAELDGHGVGTCLARTPTLHAVQRTTRRHSALREPLASAAWGARVEEGAHVLRMGASAETINLARADCQLSKGAVQAGLCRIRSGIINCRD